MTLRGAWRSNRRSPRRVSLNFPRASQHFDVRTLRDESGGRRGGKRFDEVRAIERRDIRVEARCQRGPKPPARMFHPVLTQPRTSRGITRSEEHTSELQSRFGTSYA